jgi:hypothetical protein
LIVVVLQAALRFESLMPLQRSLAAAPFSNDTLCVGVGLPLGPDTTAVRTSRLPSIAGVFRETVNDAFAFNSTGGPRVMRTPS